MADKTINGLSSGTTPLGGTEEVPIWQSSATVKVTVQDIADLASGSNIGNADLTIDSAGTRKLILGGALSTDEFVVRNSADSADFLTVNGIGSVWSDGGTGSDKNVFYGSNAPTSYAGATHENSAFGTETMDALTTGYQNTAVGYRALSAITTGFGNTAVGHNAGYRLPTFSQYNTLVGWGAATGNTAFSNSVHVGTYAGRDRTGGESVFIGAYAGQTSTSGVDNVVIGRSAGQDLTSGGYNTFVGRNSGRAITTGNYNTIIGIKNGLSATLANNVIVADGQGNEAIQKDANGNVWLGDASALATTATDGFNYVRGGAGIPTGVPATSVTGHVPMYADSTNDNLYIYSNGAWVTSADTSLATDDLTIDSSGTRKLILGGALSTDNFTIRNSADSADFFKVDGVGAVWSDGGTGSDTNTWYGSTIPASYAGATHKNSAFGDEALDALTTGYYNTAVGYRAATTISTAYGNTHVGYQAGQLATGSVNTSFGYNAGANISTGYFNTIIGGGSGSGLTTGHSNLIVTQSGTAISSGVTTGNYNVLIGNVTGLSTGTFRHVILADGAGDEALTKDNNHNIWFGDASALATTATNGFVYVRGGAGVPTGVPATSVTGHVPMYADTTNNKLYIYSGGAWVALN